MCTNLAIERGPRIVGTNPLVFFLQNKNVTSQRSISDRLAMISGS